MSDEVQQLSIEEQRAASMEAYKKSEAERAAKNAEKNMAWRTKRDERIQKEQVLGGETTVTSVPESVAEQENYLKSEGEENIGRDPETVVIGQKRTDY